MIYFTLFNLFYLIEDVHYLIEHYNNFFQKQKNDTSLIFLKVGPNGLDVVCLTPPPLLLPLEKRQKEVKKQDILVFCNFLI